METNLKELYSSFMKAFKAWKTAGKRQCNLDFSEGTTLAKHRKFCASCQRQDFGVQGRNLQKAVQVIFPFPCFVVNKINSFEIPLTCAEQNSSSHFNVTSSIAYAYLKIHLTHLSCISWNYYYKQFLYYYI